MNKKINGFRSLSYDTKTQEKIYIKTEEKNRKKYKSSSNSLPYFDDFNFILENYLNGNIDYLKSLNDSFSDAEMGSYFYIFDFRNHQTMKINAIAFDSTGKLIQ